MSMYSNASMIPGAGTALNLDWLLPQSNGFSLNRTLAFANMNEGGGGTIYDLMNQKDAADRMRKMFDGVNEDDKRDKQSIFRQQASLIDQQRQQRSTKNSMFGQKDSLLDQQKQPALQRFFAGNNSQEQPGIPDAGKFQRLLQTTPDAVKPSIQSTKREEPGNVASPDLKGQGTYGTGGGTSEGSAMDNKKRNEEKKNTPREKGEGPLLSTDLQQTRLGSKSKVIIDPIEYAYAHGFLYENPLAKADRRFKVVNPEADVIQPRLFRASTPIQRGIDAGIVKNMEDQWTSKDVGLGLMDTAARMSLTSQERDGRNQDYQRDMAAAGLSWNPLVTKDKDEALGKEDKRVAFNPKKEAEIAEKMTKGKWYANYYGVKQPASIRQKGKAAYEGSYEYAREPREDEDDSKWRSSDRFA